MRTTAARRSWQVAAVAALAVSLLVAPTASADHTDQRPCLMVRDDGKQLLEELDRRPTHDVRGGAVGSDGRRLTATIHLGAVPSSPVAVEDAAFAYTYYLTVGQDRLFLGIPADASTPASYGVVLPAGEVVLGRAHVVRDPLARELRITAPLLGFAPLASPRAGETATQMSVSAAVSRTAAAGPVTTRSHRMILDVALEGDAIYRLGDPSCVRVGG